MKLTIRELYETLQELEEEGLLDASDGEVTVVYQPSYPLSESATGVGFIVKNGTVELGSEAGDAAGGVLPRGDLRHRDGRRPEVVVVAG